VLILGRRTAQSIRLLTRQSGPNWSSLKLYKFGETYHSRVSLTYSFWGTKVKVQCYKGPLNLRIGDRLLVT